MLNVFLFACLGFFFERASIRDYFDELNPYRNKFFNINPLMPGGNKKVTHT